MVGTSSSKCFEPPRFLLGRESRGMDVRNEWSWCGMICVCVAFSEMVFRRFPSAAAVNCVKQLCRGGSNHCERGEEVHRVMEQREIFNVIFNMRYGSHCFFFFFVDQVII